MWDIHMAIDKTSFPQHLVIRGVGWGGGAIGHKNNFMSSAVVLNVKFVTNEFYIKTNTSL